MKTTAAFLLSLLAASVNARSEPEPNPPKLEVHEWGTFTVLSGSDGVPLRWVQPFDAATDLPAFVVKSFGFGKALNPWIASAAPAPGTGAALVRMETPVAYFYPEKPMRVRFEAEFKAGRLTEWFPTVALNPSPNIWRWDGDLLPPSDASAQSLIPVIIGIHGQHYGHARAVPDAWIFRQQMAAPPAVLPSLRTHSLRDYLKAIPIFGRKSAPSSQYEKFIFYRGIGDAAPPWQASSITGSSVQLRPVADAGAVRDSFLISIQDGKGAWARMPALRAWESRSASTAVSAVLPDKLMPLDEFEKSLVQEMTAALTAGGLTEPEAKAMAATWRDVWFREPGTRVLAVLPQTWADEVVPIKVEPKPAKLVRVFVGRFELLLPRQEREMLALLSEMKPLDPGGSNAIDPMLARQFQALSLGRFTAGAMERAVMLMQDETRRRFLSLSQAASQAEAAKALNATAAR